MFGTRRGASGGRGTPPPTKSGSAIGIGCMLPSVMVIRGAARTRDHRPAAAAAKDRPAAPASTRRRESVSSSDRMFRFPIAPGFNETHIRFDKELQPPNISTGSKSIESSFQISYFGSENIV